MEKRPLGRTDLSVSPLCLGTMMYGEQIGEEEAFRQMDICFERGVDFFDTAEIYTVPPKPETQGNSERIVGRWMASRGRRDKITLATKVAGRSPMVWLRDGQETRLTSEQIKSAIDRSLKNLETDVIDLYQLHWPDRSVQLWGSAQKYGYKHFEESGVALHETLGALDDLIKEGKVRHIGLSNETAWGLMRFVQEAKTKSLPRVVSIQNCYNLLNRAFETGLAEAAIEENVGLLAYSPIAQGVLTGKYLDGANPTGSRGQMFGRLDRYQTPPATHAIRDYTNLAKEAGIAPAALALQFVTTRSFVTSNIFGANGEEQLETALSSIDLKWTQELETAINKIHAETPNPCP